MREILEEVAGSFERDPVALARGKMKTELPKRFYEAVSVGRHDDAYAVLLDGKPVKTPARNVLAVPRQLQAEKLAAEWAAQETHINPATMPITRLVNSIVDGVAREMDAVADEIAKYAPGDVLLYRAEHPDTLVARQTAVWEPLVAYAEQRLKVELKRTSGIMPIMQTQDVAAALRALLPMDAFQLGALHTLTTIYGSALLALCVYDGLIDAETAHTAANLDEDWNIEKWGTDEEATQRRTWREGEVRAAALFIPAKS